MHMISSWNYSANMRIWNLLQYCNMHVLKWCKCLKHSCHFRPRKKNESKKNVSLLIKQRKLEVRDLLCNCGRNRQHLKTTLFSFSYNHFWSTKHLKFLRKQVIWYYVEEEYFVVFLVNFIKDLLVFRCNLFDFQRKQ